MPYIRVGITGYQREPGFSHFEVWRHTADITSPNSPPARVTRSAELVGERVTNTRWEDTSAVAGMTYWYWARAIDRYGNPSAFFAFDPILAPPANIKVSSDRLLGRDTAGKGDVEEIAPVAPLAFTGSQELQITIDADRLLGRVTTGTGAVEQLDAAAVLALLGFVAPILDRAVPGAIGGTTPAAGTFTDLRATGTLRFGTVASITTETVTEYITITDDAGVSRKLAVVS